MTDFLMGIGALGFFVSIILLIHSFIKRTGLIKRNLKLIGVFLLLSMLGASLEDGLSGLFTFIGIVGFLSVCILIGFIINSFLKKNGQTKRYTKLIIIPFIAMIVGFALGDHPTEASLDNEQNNEVEDVTQDKGEKEVAAGNHAKIEHTKKEKEDQTKAQQDKEQANLKNKEQTEKADRDKKDEESKKVIKDKEKKTQTGKLGQLKVHYIDVGQADATLLEVTEDGKKTTMLIDTGDWNKTDVLDYLK